MVDSLSLWERAGVRDLAEGRQFSRRMQAPTLTLSQREREFKQFIDAPHSYFALEDLQSSNLAVAAAVLSFCSDLFRIRA